MNTPLPTDDSVSPFVDAAGLTLHVRRTKAAGGTAAADAPTLVLLHSLGTDLRIWDAVVARLPTYAHLRIDLRGHGLSDVPPGDYSIASMTHDVLAVLDHVGLERAVFVGVSIGGQIALRAALERPGLALGLVLLDSAGRIGDRAAWEERMAAVRQGGLAAIADAVVGRWFAASIRERDPIAPSGYRNLLLRTPAEGYVSTCAALRDEDLTDRLSAIATPALVICGSEDSATPPALVRGLARALPRARFVEIGDAGHLPCIDRPDVTARHIDVFVRGLA